MPHAWQHSDTSPPGPSHLSCSWEACPDTTKRAYPGHRRQTFSPPNNSVSIPHIQCGINDEAAVHRAFCGHFMDTPQTPATGIQIRRAAFDGNAQFAQHVGIFTHVQCRAIPLLLQRTTRIPAPTHRLRHPPAHPHAAQGSQCGQRQLRAVAGTPNRRHPLIPRVAPRPVRLQRPPVPIVILLLHAINVVAVVVLPRCHRGSRRVHHHRQRPATHTGSIPHHAAACHVRAGKPDSMGHQVRGDAGGEASVKQDGRAMFMAPATGRPSSSVAHGSAHTPPGAAATHCTMSELAAPAEQCSAGTVNRLQTLPVASDGTTNGRSSGWMSRRSACSLTAAGTTSSATAFPCADDRAPFLQTNAPSNAFAVQHQEKPQCLLLSHGSVVGALMRTGTHRSLQTTLHTCNASCAPRGTSPTTPGDAHTPPARTASSRKQGYVRMRAGHPPAIHIAGIITSSSSSTAGRGVTWINRRMAYVEEKT
ncbi:hypothetical protein ECC02_004434 [Trypanosoma cruzi]|uniref:Uncharacterized protein n=1 Tax=Trypanosoma cruzi TaxID=5693 RepID=A0A7J6Y783_TRYCR|nr:hypothetical protein ECC02_004434 [Trypanosoma cruzi]